MLEDGTAGGGEARGVRGHGSGAAGRATSGASSGKGIMELSVSEPRELDECDRNADTEGAFRLV